MVSTGLSRLRIFGDMVHFLGLCLRPKTSLAAENLFLCKQLRSRPRLWGILLGVSVIFRTTRCYR